MTRYSEKEPEALEKIGHTYIYNWDIDTKILEDTEGNSKNIYTFNSVFVYEPISANKIFKAVMNELHDINYEQKLINEYNGVQFGLYENDPEAENNIVNAYESFLQKRIVIKATIDSVCEENGIPAK